MIEREKPDLTKIEPIGRVPEAGDPVGAGRTDDRARGADAEALQPARAPEPRSSPETEEQLDQLRRG